VRPLPSIGRAARFAVDDGAETWRFARADANVARRLAEIGRRGVGGFVAWGEDDDGAWARREPPARTAEGARELPWREAVTIVRDVAAALAACEEEALWPGRLHPARIAIAPWIGITADALVGAMVGADAAREDAAVGPWTPPEQAAGAAWDAAANRYVLGLVAYQLVAGEHPFGGAGLRHALAGQALGAPPFEARVSARTRPGVQALVLAVLDPDPGGRPRDAGAIARRCEELLGDARRRDEGQATATRGPGEARGERRPARAERSPLAPRVSMAAALVGAIVAAALAAAPTTRADRPAKGPPPARSLTDARPASCAPCHAREVAEWSRSVMAHAATSPLFGALESLVEEQVARDDDCPDGAGILRRADGAACVSRTGVRSTGAGGEGWCVRCHLPLAGASPSWSTVSRAPLRDLASPAAMDGVACGACHEAIGPVADHARAAGVFEGNPTWTSLATGQAFLTRPEDARGRRGIGNSGYLLDPASFLATGGAPHRAPSDAARAYLRSSELCGACHDVRLFGTDVLGAARGEHFKRLRNGYSEWRAWADEEARAGRAAPTCQGCHMSLFPGVCAAGGDGGDGCPRGTHFEPRAPGDRALGRLAPDSARLTPVASHAFASVDVPLSSALDARLVDDPGLDPAGAPLGVRARRDLLLARALRFAIDPPRRHGGEIEVPVVLENVGAGHRVPAGFSQEREIWVELTITDADGRDVYRVGHLEAPDADLGDKVFLRVNTGDDRVDDRGRPVGLFGADVVDGPDAPRWSPRPGDGATRFRGRGLVNLQNGFLRCVRCIGVVDARGECVASERQGITRADRFDDGDYDPDTGVCRSNLEGARALFETYFPIGALDAARGIAKAPDAILDTRSAPPGVPLTYTYAIDARGFRPPFTARARLLFRAFPPYLVRAFAAYEAQMSARGRRPSGPQVDPSMLGRIDVVTIGRAEARIE
jgi:hypothetical protein